MKNNTRTSDEIIECYEAHQVEISDGAVKRTEDVYTQSDVLSMIEDAFAECESPTTSAKPSLCKKCNEPLKK